MESRTLGFERKQYGRLSLATAGLSVQKRLKPEKKNPVRSFVITPSQPFLNSL